MLALNFQVARSGPCEGKNLKPDATLKIEKTKELPDEECGFDGMRTKQGDRIVVHYTGKLYSNCSIFDSSREPVIRPFEFELGKGEVIQGWDRGLVKMCVGETRTLTVPSNYGYGYYGRRADPEDSSFNIGIPGKAALVFDIELLAIGPRPEKRKPKIKKKSLDEERFGFSKGLNKDEFNNPKVPEDELR